MKGPSPRHLLVCVLIAVLTACGSAPRRPDSTVTTDASAGARVLASAQSRIGRPYRYGGAGPEAFDCSGLVRFSHAAEKFAVPRTATAQFQAAAPVRKDALLPGDLVFFRIHRSIDHVGIYAGGGQFVHAPSSGKVVSIAYLDDPYYAGRFAGAGRLWSAPSTEASAR